MEIYMHGVQKMDRMRSEFFGEKDTAGLPHSHYGGHNEGRLGWKRQNNLCYEPAAISI